MARGSATEEDLASGLKAVGVLGAITGVPRKRDNPFAENLSPPSMPPTDVPIVATRPESPAQREASPPPHEAAPLEESPKARAPRSSQGKPTTAPAPKPEPAPIPPPRYTDPVTVPLTAEMRTRATLLAAELQRRRLDKRNRFTTNSVFRVAIEILLARFELRPEDHVDSEDELLELVLQRLAGPRR